MQSKTMYNAQVAEMLRGKIELSLKPLSSEPLKVNDSNDSHFARVTLQLDEDQFKILKNFDQSQNAKSSFRSDIGRFFQPPKLAKITEPMEMNVSSLIRDDYEMVVPFDSIIPSQAGDALQSDINISIAQD